MIHLNTNFGACCYLASFPSFISTFKRCFRSKIPYLFPLLDISYTFLLEIRSNRFLGSLAGIFSSNFSQRSVEFFIFSWSGFYDRAPQTNNLTLLICRRCFVFIPCPHFLIIGNFCCTFILCLVSTSFYQYSVFKFESCLTFVRHFVCPIA